MLRLRVLVTARLSNRKLEDKIKPLLLSENISELIILRDTPGPRLPGVVYIIPPAILNLNWIFIAIWKFAVGLRMIVKRKVNLIISYYLLPNGLIGHFLAMLSGRPHIAVTMGSDTLFLKKIFLAPIIRSILDRSYCIIATGSELNNYIRKYGTTRRRIFSIPNTIDVLRFQKEGKSNHNRFEIIYVGNLVALKRVSVLLESISLLRRDFPEIKTAIVGDGPQRKELIQLAKDLKIESNVTFLGFRGDIPQLLSNSKILVLVSEHEGLPSVMLEAFACGTPCILSNVGSIGDVAFNGQNSILLEKISPEAILEAASELLTRPVMWHRLSKNAQDLSQKFTHIAGARIWKKILQEIKR